MNRSIPTNTSFEILNIVPMNTKVSKCEIKILYAGKNRNKTFISKDVAEKMAASLPGSPIVGEFSRESGDFKDHGADEIIVTKNGIELERSTMPYGFVPFNARLWWQTFIDKDGVEREYLLTEGYLWTGRYPETQIVIDRGAHQSMEIDPETVVGHWKTMSGEWATIDNEKEEYFIIKEAEFSALCILGENVEPCFEGANITRDSNLVFSMKDESFKEELNDFMLDLKEAMANFSLNRGGEIVSKDNVNFKSEDEVKEEDYVKSEEDKDKDNAQDSSTKKEDEKEDYVKSEENKNEEDYAKSEDEDEKTKCAKSEEEDKKEEDYVKSEEDKNEEDYAKSEEDDKEESNDMKEEEEEEEEDTKNYAKEYATLAKELLASEYKLQEKEKEIDSLRSEIESLKNFKLEVEESKKDEMIKSFYMLSDEDKKEIVENKSNFSLEEIEAKLSILCVRNKVNFDLDDASKTQDEIDDKVTTYNVSGQSGSNSPAWLKAVDRVINSK